MASVRELYTASDIAERAGVSTEAVRRWVRDGLIEAITLPSGRIRFTAEQVERILTPTRRTP